MYKLYDVAGYIGTYAKWADLRDKVTDLLMNQQARGSWERIDKFRADYVSKDTGRRIFYAERLAA